VPAARTGRQGKEGRNPVRCKFFLARSKTYFAMGDRGSVIGDSKLLIRGRAIALRPIAHRQTAA